MRESTRLVQKTSISPATQEKTGPADNGPIWKIPIFHCLQHRYLRGGERAIVGPVALDRTRRSAAS